MIEADICIIGAGAGGLEVARGAAARGKRVVLVEKGEIGRRASDAAVPLKALIAAAAAAHAQRSGAELGIAPVEPEIDGARVMARVREIAAALAQQDTLSHLAGLGVQVIRSTARFMDARTIEAGSKTVKANRFVVATGSRVRIPELPGLETAPFFTSESILAMASLPAHLVVIGGGAAGLALAQAYARLGSAVTVVDPARMLAEHDRALAQPIFDSLRRDGVRLREGAKINAIAPTDAGVRVQIARVQGPETIEGSHLLVTGTRVPELESLELAKAGIAVGPKGIKVDDKLRSSNSRVYAIGEVMGAAPFVHVARHQARLVLQSLRSRYAGHRGNDAAPHVVYCDPELAHVGMRKEDAEKEKLRFEIVSCALDETDRGRADGIGESFATIVLGRKGRILGATIVAPRASELILPWTMAIAEGIPLARMAELIVPYPTLSGHIENIAAAWRAAAPLQRRPRPLAAALARIG